MIETKAIKPSVPIVALAVIPSENAATHAGAGSGNAKTASTNIATNRAEVGPVGVVRLSKVAIEQIAPIGSG
jgi:hypothetical protein